MINCNGDFPPQPIVYTSDMTLLDRVMLIQKTLKELENYVKTGDFLNPAYQYTDKKITELQNETSEKINALSKTIENNKTELDSEIVKINASLNNIYLDLTKLENSVTIEIETAIEKVLHDVEELLKDYSILVINPVTGVTSTIQKALNDVYEVCALNTLSASEYEFLEISAENYDNRRISANDYDRKGRFIFLKELYFSTISPFTGLKENCCQIVNEIVNYLRIDKGITASEYDGLNLTASEYDAKNITAYNYDWNGNTLLN